MTSMFLMGIVRMALLIEVVFSERFAYKLFANELFVTIINKVVLISTT